MNAYYSVLKLRLLTGMQYRAAALAGVATQFFWGFMYLLIFQAFYQQALHNPPISLNELVSYIWLQQAFLAFIMLWFRDNELFNLITTGNIAYELCRPCGIYGFWYAKLLAQRLSSAFLRCFPILIVAFLLPEPYRMKWPPTFTSFLLFLAALMLGLLLLVAISMFIYISVFVTMSPVGSLLMFGVIGEFFAGLVIPIPLMPSWLQKVTNLLPFRYTADFPFRVYSGHIPQNEALTGLFIQLIWLIVLVWLGRMALNKALRRVVIQGG
ncbi:ABC transporter permease [Fictibacillus gelatini]|uniref:ABC transporter permease n=1 Tax=Fictibacillus gelatini TaxID=225985 RepID=UPI000406D986|nr:ABC transporter permease [Fictibacillus gelatini]